MYPNNCQVCHLPYPKIGYTLPPRRLFHTKELCVTKSGQVLVLDPLLHAQKLRGFSSDLKLQILSLIHEAPRNVNEIAHELRLPQSTVAMNVMRLEKAGLLRTESTKATKGSQKICHAIYDEVVIVFGRTEARRDDVIEVEMPVGLYTSFQVSPPCGLCSTEKIIGYFDVPAAFFQPERFQAGLLWFEQGYVEYKFPNNSLNADRPIRRVEVSFEASSESLEKNNDWLSDITVWVNDIEIGTWTSPRDFTDKRGKLTPAWWRNESSQYVLLKAFTVTADGAYVDGVRLSSLRVEDLHIPDHHSIKVKIGIKSDAAHVGGVNLFGRGFGNHDQGILLRLSL